MLSKLKKSTVYKQIKREAKLAGSRLADQHVSLAVTGLSGSGKTAFITSLVNQLLEARQGAVLPFFSVLTENRLIGVRREAQPDLTMKRFSYEQGMQRLTGSPPQWPESTRGVSQVRLLIKYRNQSGLRRMLSETSTLTLDITDYPGEWLLDLPLLERDYIQWSQEFHQQLQNSEKAKLAKPFLTALAATDLTASADELKLQELAEQFSEYLHAAKQAGFQLIQPGRFVLPGELVGAPVLHFFPLPAELANTPDAFDKLDDSTSAKRLLKRFEEYKSEVIQPFYRQHFKRFDRQIILVDCISALNQGAHSFHDLQKALNWLMGSFHYGRSTILRRLFSPNIDRLMFAASKADHVTPDQQENLVKLLESMVHEARQDIQFEGVTTESTAFAAIKASTDGVAELNGKSYKVLKGTDKQGQSVTLFPGEVPISCPSSDFWHSQGFAFPNFQPQPLSQQSALPHIRMDQVLEFVLADKLI